MQDMQQRELSRWDLLKLINDYPLTIKVKIKFNVLLFFPLCLEILKEHISAYTVRYFKCVWWRYYGEYCTYFGLKWVLIHSVNWLTEKANFNIFYLYFINKLALISAVKDWLCFE